MDIRLEAGYRPPVWIIGTMASGSPPLNLIDLFRRRLYKHFAPNGATPTNAARGDVI